MDDIRPPYHPEDDIPFGGERWGCFWLIGQIVGLVLVAVALLFLLRDYIPGFYIRGLLLIGFVAIIGAYMRKKYRR